MLGPLLLIWALTDEAPGAGPRPEGRCPDCSASRAEVDRSLHGLRADSWRERDAAARALGAVRWQCHPEVVAALADTLRHDANTRVRAAAAEALGRMVSLVPTGHVALADSARIDPAASVRRQAGKALAAKGLRCAGDCPICGPIPRGAAITGPTLKWPEWERRPDLSGGSQRLPPALPDPKS